MNSTVKRSISGLAFILMMLAGLLVDKFLFAALFIFIMVGMMAEFYRMTMQDKYRFSRGWAIFTGIVLFVLIFLSCAYEMPTKYIGIAFIPVMIVMANSLYSKDKEDFWMFSHLYTGILYIAVPLALANLIAFKGTTFDGTLLLSFFIIVWASDVGAYVFGMALGQRFGRKLFPAISPKKSWIGFWGGMVCAVAAALVLRVTGLLDIPVIHSVVLAMLMDVAGVYGDLFESQWKRCYELKDSGSIIPGHGGMLDRFDSTLMAFPAGVLYLALFGLI